jgi:uncharacterized protein
MTLRDARTHLDLMEQDECLRLLAGRQVGRLGVVDGGHPLVLPVNYLVAGDQILFRSDPGAKLTGSDRAPVCLEIEEIDEETRTGWSVVVQGRAERITDFDTPATQALKELPLHPWAGEKEHWVRIVPTVISGRRLSHPVKPPEPR